VTLDDTPPPVLSLAMTAAVALVNMRGLVEAMEGKGKPEYAHYWAWRTVRVRYSD
jgi:hypothetical protein